MKRTLLTISLLSLLCSGCTTLGQYRQVTYGAIAPSDIRFMRMVDSNIKESNDAVKPVGDYYVLRSNRFLNSLAQKDLNKQQEQLLIQKMRDLYLSTRYKEIYNHGNFIYEEDPLPKALTIGMTKPNIMYEKVDTFTHKIVNTYLENDEYRKDILNSVKDVSRYSKLLKLFGYPLFYLAARPATERAYAEFVHWHKQDFDDAKVVGTMTVFTVNANQKALLKEANQVYQGIDRDSLDVLVPNPNQLDKLFKMYAPIIHQDVDDTFDEFGEVTWNNGRITINTDKPTVYYYATNTYIQDKPALQLNYAVWYEGRLGPNAPWLERGELDGFTIRVTLDQDGVPIFVDTTNNCGCYHAFIPNENKVLSQIDNPGLDSLVLRQLPKDYPQKPLNIKVNTGWHQIIRLKADNAPSTRQTYELVKYDILEMLPHEDGQKESVFNKKGIMKDSFRIEPYLFFPSGVRKVGYMRQRNNHPIKLIGEDHFSDPYLFDKNFIYQ